jgi:hypothetical protein
LQMRKSMTVRSGPSPTFSFSNSGVKYTSTPSSFRQGLTLVHFSAQRKRFDWNMGCI